jgi:multiple antibiotic resistance protein
MNLYIYIQAAITMTAVINPMVAGMMLLQMEEGKSAKEKFAFTTKATLLSTLILLIAAILGQFILKFFGISLEVFRIVGGVIVAYIGFRMLSGQMLKSSVNENSTTLNDLVIFMASPGSIAAAITLSAVHTPGKFPITAVIAIVFAMLFTFVEIVLMIKLAKKIDISRQRLGTQFMGIIVIAMGLQFALEGYKSFMAL